MAGFFVVLARAGEKQPLFLVSRDTLGLEIARRPGFMHDPYIDGHVELRLSGCRVLERDLLPNGDDGARRWFTIERLMIAARCCGAASRLLELASDWAAERKAFGRHVGDGEPDRRPTAAGLRRPRLHDRASVERHFRELRVDRIWEGTSEIQRVIVVRGLFKRGVGSSID